jgi:hypothetical protein
MQRLMYRYRIYSSLIINGILSNIAMWFSNFPPLKSSGAYAYFDVVSRDKSLELTVGMKASIIYLEVTQYNVFIMLRNQTFFKYYIRTQSNRQGQFMWCQLRTIWSLSEWLMV